MKKVLFECFSGLRSMMILLAAITVMPMAAQYVSPTYYKGGVAPHRYRYASTDIYYGLRLGVNVSTVNSDDLYLNGGTAKSGLNLGVVAGFQLAPGSPVYLEAGLSYMEKGGKGKYEGAKFTYNMDYLEVPLVMRYCFDVDRSFSVQPFLGGYLGVGVAGKIKNFRERQAYSSFDNEGFQRFDAGLRVGCGAQYDHIYAELGYDFGLANISHDYFDTSHNGCFFATIGVNF